MGHGFLLVYVVWCLSISLHDDFTVHRFRFLAGESDNARVVDSLRIALPSLVMLLWNAALFSYILVSKSFCGVAVSTVWLPGWSSFFLDPRILQFGRPGVRGALGALAVEADPTPGINTS